MKNSLIKNSSLFFLGLLIFTSTRSQNIGIGTQTPHASSLLEISSLNKGLLIPRMGAGQRTGIGSPAKGLMVYDTSSSSFWLYNGLAWDELQNISSNIWQRSGNNIYNGNSGFTGIGRISPGFKLDVLDSTTSNMARFTGGDNMWITIAEKTSNRGYIGSYSGNPEDVDFGTYGSNTTGKVHLTTGSTPRLTVAPGGLVGINNVSPDGSAILDVVSTNKGVVFPRLTTTQRGAIFDPPAGLLVYDLNYQCYFMFDGFNWMALAPTNPAELKLGTQAPADVGSSDQFGFATAIDSLYAIVGAPSLNSSVGAAYIYKKTNNVWAQMTKLLPDVSSPQLFGRSVSIDFPYAVVGAPGYNVSQGAVYVFYFNGSAWVQLNKFLKPGVAENAQFGASVDIDNKFIVAGAPLANNFNPAGGAVFTYKLNAGVWSYHQTITYIGIGVDDSFGYATALSDSFMVIGSPLHDNGVRIDEGLAYKYKLSTGDVWTYQSTLLPLYYTDIYGAGIGNPISGNWKYKKFGSSVDIRYNSSGSNIYEKVFTVVGAPESYFYLNPSQTATNMGLVCLYMATPNPVAENRCGILYRVKVPGQYDDDDLFGSSVSLSGYKGNLVSEDSQIDLQLLVGSPGFDNDKGKVYRYSIEKTLLFHQSSGGGGDDTYTFPWSRNYQAVLKTTYSENIANANTGFSCAMFDLNAYVTSLLGLSFYRGGVIFKF